MPDRTTDLWARLWLRRRAVAYWAAVAALATVTAGVLSNVADAAHTAAGRWGEGEPTVVAARDLPAGHRLDGDDLDLVDLPPAARPPGALRQPPVGATLRSEVFAGEALGAGRVGTVGEGGVAAAVPTGSRGVAVERGTATPPVSTGDVVELRATTLDRSGAVVGTVAGTGPVVAVGEDVLVVAVPTDDVHAVVEARSHGDVVVVVVPARDRPG